VASNQRERLMNITEGIYPKPGDNHQYETTLLHHNGQLINVIISLAPTHSNTYESDWIVQIIDISHRIAFEQLLQEESNFNQSILNAVEDAIITLDENGNIRSVNPAASRIFGYTEDQFIHHHINHFVQDPESGSIMRHIKYHNDECDINSEINHDIIGLKIDGEAFSVELQLSCIYRKQEKLFIAVIRDVSERKHLKPN
jgi:PAS domain S-box-containing protein